MTSDVPKSNGSSAVYSFGASQAFIGGIRQGPEETQDIRDLKERFKSIDVDAVVPPDLRNTIWSVDQKQTYLTVLNEKRIHPQAVRYVLTQEMQREGVDLKERVAFSAKILKVAQLMKYREELVQALGADDFQFLTGFLERAGTLGRDLPVDSFEGMALLEEISKTNIQRFTKIADVVFSRFEQEQEEIVRNPTEWKRFAANLPFKLRIELAKREEAQLTRASQFWTQLKKSLPLNNSEKAFVQHYFSRFSLGVVSAKPEDFAQIENVLKRGKASQQIAEQCIPLLELDSIQSINQQVRDFDLLAKAEKAQLSFDTYLEKMKRLDVYYLLAQTADRQQTLFEILSQLPENSIPALKETLSPEDQEIVQDLLEKQAKTKLPLPQVVEQTLASSLAKVPGYKKELNQEIQQLNEELKNDAHNRSWNLANDLINPDGIAIRGLLAATRDLRVGNSESMIAKLKARAEEIREKRKQDGFLLSDEELSRLEAEELALNNQIEALELRPLERELDRELETHSFFDDFYVFPVDNVVYHTEDKKMDGKWIVVDLRDVEDIQDKEKIVRQLTPDFLRAQIKGKAPYETVSFDPELTRLAHKRGPVKIFFEDAIAVRKSQQDLDIGQRSRLVRLIPDPKHPIKQEDALNYARVKEAISEANAGEIDPWDLNAKRTATVDRAQAIWTSKLLLADLLLGKARSIEPNAYRGIGVYLDAVQGSDLSKFPGSFLEHPNFIQAVNNYGATTETMTKLLNERLHVAGLKLSEDKKNYKLAEAGVRLMEIYSTFKKWNASIDKFFNLMPRKLRDDFVSYTEEFKRIQTALKMFIEKFPSDIEELYNKKPKEQNFFPTGLITEYIQEKGAASLEKLIRKSLEGNGAGQDLGHRFHSIFPTLIKLAQIQTSPALSAKHREIMDKVDRESQKGLEFAQAVDIALGNCFQGAPRIEMPLAEMANVLSEFSEMNVVVRKAWTVMKQATLSLEEMRSKQSRQLLQNAVGRNANKTVLEFYSPKKKSTPPRTQFPR